ncbi:MAG: hypothetical protein LBE12_00970 [Planctomycetaceae bacterium]|nr:hypothetical protein [Planctomycetaceae bacterium]
MSSADDLNYVVVKKIDGYYAGCCPMLLPVVPSWRLPNRYKVTDVTTHKQKNT